MSDGMSDGLDLPNLVPLRDGKFFLSGSATSSDVSEYVAAMYGLPAGWRVDYRPHPARDDRYRFRVTATEKAPPHRSHFLDGVIEGSQTITPDHILFHADKVLAMVAKDVLALLSKESQDSA